MDCSFDCISSVTRNNKVKTEFQMVINKTMAQPSDEAKREQLVTSLQHAGVFETLDSIHKRVL